MKELILTILVIINTVSSQFNLTFLSDEHTYTNTLNKNEITNNKIVRASLYERFQLNDLKAHINKTNNTNNSIIINQNKNNFSIQDSTVLSNFSNKNLNKSARWPNSFNATLSKISPLRNETVWVKHYYDWDLKGQRFDFYNSYVNYPEGDWKINCTVLFKNTSIWFIFPEENSCKLRSSVIPPVNPDWVNLLGGKYVGERLFRGIRADVWEMDDPDDSSHKMVYYARADDNRSPLRSPNQINDPGATDFFDVEIGKQSESYFEVPTYCLSSRTEKGCPWY